jgi:hypothetical protein
MKVVHLLVITVRQRGTAASRTVVWFFLLGLCAPVGPSVHMARIDKLILIRQVSPLIGSTSVNLRSSLPIYV